MKQQVIEQENGHVIDHQHRHSKGYPLVPCGMCKNHLIRVKNRREHALCPDCWYKAYYGVKE